jgi:hypothetical protein
MATEFSPNLQDNAAANSIQGLVPYPWVDLGVEFKFFRYSSNKRRCSAGGLVSSKMPELVWDLEKMITYSGTASSIVRVGWLAVFEESGADLALPGVYSKLDYTVAFDRIKPRQKELLEKLDTFFSKHRNELCEKGYVVGNIDHVKIGYCWRRAKP